MSHSLLRSIGFSFISSHLCRIFWIENKIAEIAHFYEPDNNIPTIWSLFCTEEKRKCKPMKDNWGTSLSLSLAPGDVIRYLSHYVQSKPLHRRSYRYRYGDQIAYAWRLALVSHLKQSTAFERSYIDKIGPTLPQWIRNAAFRISLR